MKEDFGWRSIRFFIKLISIDNGKNTYKVISKSTFNPCFSICSYEKPKKTIKIQSIFCKKNKKNPIFRSNTVKNEKNQNNKNNIYSNLHVFRIS